jgi:hypothetical protein
MEKPKGLTTTIERKRTTYKEDRIERGTLEDYIQLVFARFKGKRFSRFRRPDGFEEAAVVAWQRVEVAEL